MVRFCSGPFTGAFEKALDRADAVIVLGEDTRNVATGLPQHIPHLLRRSQRRIRISPILHYVLCICGAGHTDKFFDYLRDDLALDIQRAQALSTTTSRWMTCNS